MERYYRISESELMELLEGNLRLLALENGGVENWDWYGDSLNDFQDRLAKELGREEVDFTFLARKELENYDLI